MKFRQLCAVLCAGLTLFIVYAGTCYAGDEELLRDKAELIIDAQVNNHWGIVYDLATTEYKKSITKEKFINMRRGVVYKNYSIDKVVLQNDSKEALVLVKSDLNMMGIDIKSAPFAQKWTREDDGEWHFVINSFKDLFQSP